MKKDQFDITSSGKVKLIIHCTLLMSRFWGFRSLWRTLQLWQKAKPLSNWYMNDYGEITTKIIINYHIIKFLLSATFLSFFLCFSTCILLHVYHYVPLSLISKYRQAHPSFLENIHSTMLHYGPKKNSFK